MNILVMFKKLKSLLDASERKRGIYLLALITIMALFDVVGVASIMPFMAVLSNPQLIETNRLLIALYDYSALIGITTANQFLFALGVAMFFLLLLSLGFKALTSYAQLRFTHLCECGISKRLIEGYLRQPYVWFLNQHSTDIGKTILSEVAEVVHGGIMPLITIVAQTAVTISLLTLLLIIDPLLAISIGIILSLGYVIIFKCVSGFLGRISSESYQFNNARFRIVGEVFGAIQEVKIFGCERAFIQNFGEVASGYAKHQASGKAVSQLPRFALEAIAFGGMIILVLLLMSKSGNFAIALPIIALYAYAGYRLMPALQQIYSGLSQLRFTCHELNKLSDNFFSLGRAYDIENSGLPLIPENSVKLESVHFKYPNAPQLALQDINISIPSKGLVGLVGTTGSGKSTIVNLILGLIEPQSGCLKVDHLEITAKNCHQWQQSIGYVPQQIFLSDSSVASNIAFGVPSKDINQEMVERAAKVANLHDFIVEELPQSYATKIGERGIRLSGGQRQRIGIARALYRNPSVLILDEATSALDSLTEQSVMDAVGNLGREMTIILVAHRLTTVYSCDKIYLLEKGRVRAQGTYEELKRIDEQFHQMTRQ